MRIQYITNVRLPTDKAQGYAIVKMCSEFARSGVETELFVPNKSNNDNKKDPFEYYGIEKNFTITKISSLDLLGRTLKFGRIFYWIDIFSFSVGLRFSTKFDRDDVLYTRDFVLASFFSKRRMVCLELHAVPKSSFLFKRALKRASFFVVLNTYIKKRLTDLGVDEKKILVSSSAVDLAEFAVPVSRPNIPSVMEDDFIFVYVGTLKTMGMEKGLDLGLQALTFLPKDYTFLVAGGESEEIEYYKQISTRLGVSDRVVFVGKVPQSERHAYMMYGDALIAPFPENEHYSFFMSPLKIFEYMASKKPIITTDLPSLREILTDGENSVLITQNNPRALADAMIKLKENPEYAQKIAEKAYQDVIQKYTWQKRARDILDFLKK